MENKKNFMALLIILIYSSHLSSQDSSRPLPQSPPPLITNLQLPLALVENTIDVRGSDDAVLFTVQETTDLNGDGDTNDFIAHFLNSQGVLIAIPYATHAYFNKCNLRPHLSGDYVVFVVRESDHFSTDLNGDGDTNDLVVHVYSIITGLTTNLGWATSSFEFELSPISKSSRGFAFTVDESEHGNVDLNSNGSTTDRIAFYHELASGQTANTGLAISPDSCFDTNAINVNRKHLVLNSGELYQGDLNGDGDTNDYIINIFNIDSGTTTNTFLSGKGVVGKDYVILSMNESLNDIDHNQDGDKNDHVIHVHDDGTLTNIGLAGDPTSFATTTNTASSKALFYINELDEGNNDLNGDGKFTDIVYSYDSSLNLITNLNVPIHTTYLKIQSYNDSLVFLEAETVDGNDLNGDGDTLDRTIVIVDTSAGNSKTAIPYAAKTFRLDKNYIGIVASETKNGNQDLNGNGILDTALVAGNISTGQINPVEGANVSSNTYYSIHKHRIAYVNSESGTIPTDYNFDGDTTDLVQHIYNIESQQTHNLKLTVHASIPPYFTTLNGTLLGFGVSESTQGNSDLNNDGDTNDVIMHLVKLPTQP